MEEGGLLYWDIFAYSLFHIKWQKIHPNFFLGSKNVNWTEEDGSFKLGVQSHMLSYF